MLYATSGSDPGRDVHIPVVLFTPSGRLWIRVAWSKSTKPSATRETDGWLLSDHVTQPYECNSEIAAATGSRLARQKFPPFMELQRLQDLAFQLYNFNLNHLNPVHILF